MPDVDHPPRHWRIVKVAVRTCSSSRPAILLGEHLAASAIVDLRLLHRDQIDATSNAGQGR